MKKRFQCGHLGKGKYCHRCALADVLEKELETPPSNRAERRAQEANAEHMRAEIIRLRTVPTKRGALPAPQPPIETKE